MLHRKKKTILVLTSLYGGLGLFLISTNPRNLSIGLLLLPLMWLFLCLMYSAWLFLNWLKIADGDDNRFRRLGFAATFAAVPVGLLLLNSVDQLTVKDIALIILLSATVFIYVSRFRMRQKIG